MPALKSEKDNIKCDGEIVFIDNLVPDPLNARLHPERNLEAIRHSLARYGQRKPLVVREQGMVVVAGNGTLAAAKELGWTKMACSIRPMTDAEAIGYGLADNRTAELARWDYEVVAMLRQMVGEHSVERLSVEEIISIRGETGPLNFPEVDESIETEHECPKCGYRFSGGPVYEASDGSTTEE